ncbi:MAG: efflux RND transporter periplasmic adaptor subunit, partial [Gammaproteobacteria bacterium]
MNTSNKSADLNAILARQGGAGTLRRRRVPLIVGVLVLLALLYVVFGGNGDAGKPQYRTETAITGTLMVRVSATG